MTNPTPPSEADYDEATRLYDEACADSRTEGIEWIARALAARTERATMEERERCARLADDHARTCEHSLCPKPEAWPSASHASVIAAAIRGRKP